MEFGIGSDVSSLERGVFLNTRVLPDGRVIFKHHLASPPPGRQRAVFDSISLWPLAENISVSVFLVHGNRGILAVHQVDEFLSRVPGSRALQLEAGHNVQRDAPQELARAIATLIPPSPLWRCLATAGSRTG